MPVRKFRDVSEMEGNTWRERGPELHDAIRRAWEFAARTVEHRFPPGVYRHRSFEELDAKTEQWAQTNFEAFQARRAKPPI
jgi:hypothetical protein